MSTTKHTTTIHSTGPTITRVKVVRSNEHKYVTVIAATGDYTVRCRPGEDAKDALLRFGREQLDKAKQLIRYSDIYFKAADTIPAGPWVDTQ